METGRGGGIALWWRQRVGNEAVRGGSAVRWASESVKMPMPEWERNGYAVEYFGLQVKSVKGP
jgi:hypothetical protein